MRAAILLVLALALASCGGAEDDPDAASEGAPRAGAVSERSAVDVARASAVKRYLRSIKVWKRWSLDDVTVDGATVAVDTKLFPKGTNRPSFTGACTSLMDVFDWAHSVEVRGSDQQTHARWAEGDALCEVDLPDPEGPLLYPPSEDEETRDQDGAAGGRANNENRTCGELQDPQPSTVQANASTSCAFAINVAHAALEAVQTSGGRAFEVTAFSPATGMDIEMSCSSDGSNIECRGGTSAVVRLQSRG